jgi:SAM-dependent methyltransferase
MDVDTLNAYNVYAKPFAQEWHAQPQPSDLYTLLNTFFTPGPTADIGCGAGRDVAWLNNAGFDTVGYDASDLLLDHARYRYPDLRFELSSLPDLANIVSERFQNILCESVIMHLDLRLIRPSVARMLDLLVPGGVLYISWRVMKGTAKRDQHRRLYSAFDKSLILQECLGHRVLLDREDLSEASGKRIQRMIIRKRG